MAIAQRGTGSSDGANNSSENTVTLTKPTGLTAGDLLLAVITTNDQVVTKPNANWVQLFNLQGTANSTWRTYAFYCVATSTEVAASNYAFTVPNADNPMVGTLSAWSGVDATTPIGTNWNAVVTGAEATEPATGPTATNTANDGRVIYIRSVRQASATDQTLAITEAVAGVTAVPGAAKTGKTVNTTVYANTQFAADADFTGNGNKTGLATSCNKTETDNVQATIVLKMAGVPASGSFDATLTGVSMSATGEVHNDGVIASTLGNVQVAFQAEHFPPASGTIAATLSPISASFAGTSTGGAFAATLNGVTSSWTGSVEPIGVFSATLQQVSMAFAGETVPFGAHVIHVEAEGRAFRVIDADPGIISIDRDEVTGL